MHLQDIETSQSESVASLILFYLIGSEQGLVLGNPDSCRCQSGQCVSPEISIQAAIWSPQGCQTNQASICVVQGQRKQSE